MEIRAELMHDARAHLGEGPVWDPRVGVLWWVDIRNGALHRFDPDTGPIAPIEVGQEVGAVSLRTSGGLVMAVRDGFATLDDDGRVSPLVHVEADREENRMNEGKCDPAGRFWASTMSRDHYPNQGALYCLAADGAVRKVLDEISIGNGLAWSADRKTMYYIDTLTCGVDAFDYDVESGQISNRRQIIGIPYEQGFPDGMCIDAEGALWVALWAGACVRRYSTTGELLAQIDLPTSNVSSCVFGGPDLTDLYITTARQGLGEKLAAEPLAGALFRARPGVAGAEVGSYAG